MNLLKYIKNSEIKPCLVNNVGYYSYYNKDIDSNIVYITCQGGTNLVGNMLRIAQELSKAEYQNFKIYVQVQKTQLSRIKNIAKQYNIRARFLARASEQLYIIEQAKYIFTDTTLLKQFIKRDGQIVVNTWHGTPFKNMGRRIKKEELSIGNTQRSLLMSDYILFQNNYTKDIFIRDYMLGNIWRGKSLLAGYPRNGVFFDEKRREEVLKKLNLNGKRVYAYLPTFRGVLGDKKNIQQVKAIEGYLKEIDAGLSDGQVLLVKLHLYNRIKIDFSKYNHIVDFPEGYETYDILNIADCLITDYSSVFFDFANTKKKIVLFIYDKEEYLSIRGIYFSFDELPFPKVDNVHDLLNEINSPKNYDDKQFLDKYCLFDNINATKLLCEHIIKQKKTLIEQAAPYNGKKNIFIYLGNLWKNGITSAAASILENLDHNKNNYIALIAKDIVKSYERVNAIPGNINYYSLDGRGHYRLFEKIAYAKLWYQKQNVKITLDRDIEIAFDREYEKYFHGINVDAIIDFCGYDKGISFMLSRSKAKKTIFVHSNMIREAELRHNQRLSMLNYFYNQFDKVAIVSDDLYESTLKISGNKENIVTVNNCHDYIAVRKKAEKTVNFEKDTECIIRNPRGLLEILNDKSAVKFITIGRFSPEKGHFRLIDAFDMYWQDNKDSFLIIIGGHGLLFEATSNYAKSKLCWRNVIIIKSVRNPMPILKRCDLFILSSLYEGLGLVILEADCLGIPSISTDIDGPRGLFKKYNGILVNDSTEGIFEGMRAFDRGEVRLLDIDYEKYRQQSIAEFEALL